MAKPFVRSPYNYDRDKVSRETSYVSDEPSMTVQSSKDECDINTIVKRFGLTGTMPAAMIPPSYADYEGIFDFHTAMNAVREAGESFMLMPADVRAEFQNDPQRFLAFCSDSKNLPRMRELGLAIPEVKVDTTPVVSVNEVKPNARSNAKGAGKAPESSEGSGASSAE